MRHAMTILALLTTTQALAGSFDVTLTPGNFTIDGKSATQLITAKNNGGPIFDLIVECGFLKDTALVTTARESSLNVAAGQTIYMQVTSTAAGGANRADCRVSAAVADFNAIKQVQRGVDVDNPTAGDGQAKSETGMPSRAAVEGETERAAPAMNSSGVNLPGGASVQPKPLTQYSTRRPPSGSLIKHATPPTSTGRPKTLSDFWTGIGRE
jgi:hypothetical protein